MRRLQRIAMGLLVGATMVGLVSVLLGCGADAFGIRQGSGAEPTEPAEPAGGMGTGGSTSHK